MKPQDILIAIEGILILILFTVILYMRYLYKSKIRSEMAFFQKKIQKKHDKQIEKIKSSMSHGFRMPLAIISGYGDILLKENLKEENTYKEYIKKICDNATYLSQMVNRILIQIQDKINIPVCKLEPINLVDIVQNTVINSEKLLLNKGIFIQTNYDGLSILILGDRIQLTNVLNNFFDNSIKYMKCSGFINITVSKIGDKVMFVYKDNGKGMKSEEVSKIFNESYQGSNGEEGFGNGMYIVLKIMEAHNAQIQVVSEENEGMGIYIFFDVYRQSLINL